MNLAIYIIDAFSSKPFGGNPAAVCLDDTPEGLPKEAMSRLAAELNLPETAFIRQLSNSPEHHYSRGRRFGLRWFTPTVEVKLCGHATMASAAALYYCLDNPSDMLEFDTLSGILTVAKAGKFLELNLPLDSPVPLSEQEIAEYRELLEYVAKPEDIADVQFGVHNQMLIVRLTDKHTRTDLESIKAPGGAWSQASTGDKVLAVGVTLRARQDDVDAENVTYDFLSRFFGINCGIDEDHVTGALHTILSGYWMKELGKSTLYSRQCSARGGDLRMEVKEDGRVLISGPATVFLKGQIQI